MIIQAIKKNEPKMSQKVAKKGIVNRGVILTFIELLLLTLILFSCQKESEVKMLTKRVSVLNIATIGNTVSTASINFIVDTVNSIVIKGLTSSIIFNSKGSTADNVMSVGSSIGIQPTNDIIKVDKVTSVTSGSVSSLIALPVNNQVFVNIPISAGKEINYEAIVCLTNVAVDDVEFVATLLIEYELP